MTNAVTNAAMTDVSSDMATDTVQDVTSNDVTADVSTDMVQDVTSNDVNNEMKEDMKGDMKNAMADLMKSYLDGKASEDERKRLEEYVSASEENRKEYMDFRRIWEAANAPFGGGDIDMKRAKRRLLDGIGAEKPLGKRILRFWETAAAVLLLPLVGFTAYLAFAHWGESDIQPGEVCLSAPYGSVVRASLPDGTAVCLNSGSSLSYSTLFPAEGRTVRMEGEAYFDVVSDKSNPFIVRLGDDIDVTATGTSFNINAYDPSRLRVTLVEGVLDVGCSGTRHNLAAGEQLVRSGDGVRCGNAGDLFRWISWKDDILAFRGDDMAYVFSRLSDIFNVRIEVTDKKIEDMKLRATFCDEKIGEIMSLLEQVLPIRCELVPGDPADRRDGARKKYVISSK